MKEGLNLLPSMAKFQAAKIKLKKKIVLVMSVFLSVWILSIIVILGYLWFDTILLDRANKSNASALSQYKTLASNATLSQRNKYQAKLVGKVLSERFEYGASMVKMTGLFSDQIVLKNFQIDGPKRFVLSGSLSDGSGMKEVEEKIKEINSGLVSDFKSAKLNFVSIKQGFWLFQMEVDLV